MSCVPIGSCWQRVKPECKTDPKLVSLCVKNSADRLGLSEAVSELATGGAMGRLGLGLGATPSFALAVGLLIHAGTPRVSAYASCSLSAIAVDFTRAKDRIAMGQWALGGLGMG